MKKAGVLLMLLVCAFYAPLAYKSLTGGFRFGKLALDLPSHPTTVVELPAHEFTYLGRGTQSFVFMSLDGRYVLKLFRREQWVHPWRAQFRKKKRSKPTLNALLAGAKLAFDKAQDLTGLIAVHLHPGGKPEAVMLHDKLGRTHTIDLNRCSFAVQHRGVPFREELFRAMREHDLPKTERLLTSFVQLVRTRVERGIRNTDAKVSSNFGVLGDRVIEWDFGSYTTASEVNAAHELGRFAPALRHSLRKRSPEAAAMFERLLEEQ